MATFDYVIVARVPADWETQIYPINLSVDALTFEGYFYATQQEVFIF